MPRKSDKYSLNAKQQLFVDAYLKYFSPKKAAEIAGYSGNNLSKIGYQTLQSVAVKAAVEEGLNKRKEALDIVPFEIIIIQLVEIASDPDVSLRDRMRASDLLLKYKQHNSWSSSDAKTVDSYVDALKSQVGEVWDEHN